jgi:hypothetical protein
MFSYEYKEWFVVIYNLWVTWSICPAFCLASSEYRLLCFCFLAGIYCPWICHTFQQLGTSVAWRFIHYAIQVKARFNWESHVAEHGLSTFSWHRDTPFIVGQFAGRKWKNNTKCYKYAFLRRGSKAVCPMSCFTACKRTPKVTWKSSLSAKFSAISRP